MTAKIKLNAASGGGSFSLQAPSSSANNRVMTLPDSADGTILTTTNPKSGNIIQVVSTTKTTQQTITTSGDTSYPSGAVDIMTVAITPTQSDSKVLITSTVQATCEDSAMLYMHRDTTLINVGTEGSSSNNGVYRGWIMIRQATTNQTYSYTTQFLDSPATTNAITYKIKGLNTASSESLFINRRKSNDTFSLTSFLTVMEVAA
nr:Cell surface glycoprotein 1 [uncultured Mediterranean phage uvMED]